MFCSKCGSQNDQDISFCRKCGTSLESSALSKAKRDSSGGLTSSSSKDPDQLMSDGIGGVIVGDGFFMAAVMLTVMESSVSSPLWLLLLIPAFYFFGRGLANVLHARQIRSREKLIELNEAPASAALPPPHASVGDILKKSISGELTAPSVTERTTRNLN
ncbi:MAG TPA: zinc ribbon domain-containing protein [Pyrinomonadaceae bacterium]|nr:zinc ribbon domain-containing protein [Pyrinomonadaceae bacterium]